ncbi:hypothetical protein PBCVFr5L_163L [Paramecium bursaria Chlorella virus Fr5L]|nr:hypothetical protein PBCVFr5L_163L [Paramecium bursaria Chlorella virus Fr5L]
MQLNHCMRMPVVCNHPECKKYANYNFEGSKARWCKAHKTSDMIDVRSKKCPCGKISNFNVPGEIMGICCKECKTSEMVNVVSKKCACGKRPKFNIPRETVGICCKECKTEDMIDVVNKMCPCGTRPYFNSPGETKGICCVECKTSEMIDVVSKKCLCGKIPIFNIPGETVGICCKECKTDEMIDVKNNKCPGYNGEKCLGYRLVPGCQYCLSCDPDDSRRETRKKYENAFFRHVKGKIDIHRREFKVDYDPKETTKKWARLDGIVFGDGIIVCLEVDENGHESYVCDKPRMHMVTAELLKQYPHTDVCWVRVNPTTKHKNLWGIAAKRERAERFDAVIKIVSDVLENKTTNIVFIGFD